MDGNIGKKQKDGIGSGEASDRVSSGRAREEEWLWRRRARRELETGEIGWVRGVVRGVPGSAEGGGDGGHQGRARVIINVEYLNIVYQHCRVPKRYV